MKTKKEFLFRGNTFVHSHNRKNYKTAKPVKNGIIATKKLIVQSTKCAKIPISFPKMAVNASFIVKVVPDN